MSNVMNNRTSRRFASPRARRALRLRGLDLDATRVLGSGPNGRIEEADVLRFEPTTFATTEKIGDARSTFILRAELDVSALENLQKRHEISTRDFLQRALSCALSTHAAQSNVVCQISENASRRAFEYCPALPTGAHGVFGVAQIANVTLRLCLCGDAARQEILETVFDAVCEIVEDPMLLVFS